MAHASPPTSVLHEGGQPWETVLRASEFAASSPCQPPAASSTRTAPTTTPMTLSYTINKCSSDICRIRLDYDQFVLSPPVTTGADATPAVVGGPDVATDIAIDGQCQTDMMTITTTALITVPITAPTGTAASIGNFPYFCGTNTGYHP